MITEKNPEIFAKNFLEEKGSGRYTLDDLVDAYYEGINTSTAEKEAAKAGFRKVIKDGVIRADDKGYLHLQ